jgi:tyrosinase
MDLWDPALLWYARAVEEMKKRPMNDSTSWKYQAAIQDMSNAFAWVSLSPLDADGAGFS